MKRESMRTVYSALALACAAGLAAAARADATWKGVDGVFSSDDNWWDAMPATNETARFTGDSAGSFVTMDAAHDVGYIWVGDTADAKATDYISTDMSTTNCVTFTAQSSECGMTSAGNFACADGEGQRGALTIESGTYSATGFAYWGWGPSVKFVANLNGGNVNINGANGSIGFFTGWGANNASTFNLAGGNLNIANDISVESGDATTYTTFNISNGSTLSCGTASTAKWMKIPTSGTGNIAINLNAGGTLSAWHLRHQSTGMTRINFNGGTFHVLGNIGYGIVGYDNGANASTFVMELKSGGGTIATDFNVGINNPVTGSGSFTKAGTGTLTFDVMPSFTGTITVPQGCGTVVLPSGATIATGTDTATRTLSSGQVEYYYYHSEAMNDNIFTAGANCTITLDGEATINITKAVTIGALTVTGTGTLNIAGSGKVTATSLQIGADATVVLPDGMTLTNPNSPLYVKNDSVSGAGVIAYTGVAPDSLASYADGSSWSGTVWIRGLSFTDWNPSSSYGNSLSTLRLSGCSGRFAKAQIAVPYAIELENSGYSSALNLTNGYSFNSNGAWSYFFTPELKGTGTLAANGTGGTLFVAQTCGDFAGVFSLSGKTVWLGYDAPNSEYDEDKTEGVRSGAVRIKEGVETGMGGAWTLSKLVGAGTVRMLAPYYASSSFGTAVSDSSLWTGTVVLAAQVATGSTAVWPARMGNANSVIRFEGLSSNGGSHYFGDNTAVAAHVYLDGDVTLDNGSSGVTYTLGTVSGTGNLTVAPAGLGGSMAVTITKLEDYTGTLAGLASKGIVNVAGVVMDAVPVEGDKLFSVSTQENYRNVYASPVSIYVGDAVYSGSTTLGEDGYYLSYAGRGLYWVGPEGGYWDDDANWRLADGSATEAPRTSGCVDIVYFTNTASVVVKSHAYAYQVNIAADASLTLQSENNGAYLRPYEITGEGVLRLAGGWIGSTGQPLVVNCDVEVVEDTTNYLACNSGYRVELHGSLTGSGTLIANHAGQNYTGAKFYGDNRNFAGTFQTTNYGTRDATYMDTWISSSSNAVWKIDTYTSKSTDDLFPSGDGEYKYFGAFIGTMWRSRGTRLEIGARDDVDSSLAPYCHITASYTGYTIRKVGDSLLTLVYGTSGNNNYAHTKVEALEIAKGTVLLPHGYIDDASSRALGTITFTGEGGYLRTPVYKDASNSDVSPDVSAFIVNSTAPIGFDTNGETITLTNAISATNMGGLRKKGAGTLVLTAVPKFSGPVIVEEGTLTLPVGTSASGLSLGANGILQLDLGNYSGTGIIFAAPKVAGSVPFTTGNIRVVNAPSDISVNVTDSSVLIMSGSGSIRRWTGKGTKTVLVEDTEAKIEVADPDWNNPGNWKDNTVPESSDTVMFTDVAPGFTLTNDVNVASLLVDTGDPDKTGFTYSADCALNVLGSMTIQYPGALSVSGSGSLDVTGSMVGVTGVAMTPTNATIAIAKSHPYYSERITANNDLGLTSLDGAGTISSGADQTITIAKNKESTFYGTFTGAMGLVKEGEGTLVLQGPNSFTGDIDIREGTLKVAPYNYYDLVAYDIDASRATTDGWTMNSDNEVSNFTTPYGWQWPWTCKTVPYAQLTTDYFDGRTAMKFSSTTVYQPDYSSPKDKRAWSTITVCQAPDVSTRQFLHCYSSVGDYIQVASGAWSARSYNVDVSKHLYIDGGYGERTATAGKKTVVSLVQEYPCSDQRNDALGCNGNGFLGAIAQVVGFKAYVSPEVRAAVEAYLMQKWGCDDATEHQILPATAALTMASADVEVELDLGGMTQTVKSFTGAGYIHDGILRTADGRVVVTGKLQIPAARGTTYFLDASASDTLILTGKDPAEFEGIKFDFPSGAKAIPRVAIPVGIWEDSEANAKFLAAVTTKVDNWSVSHRIIYNEEYMVFRYGAYPFFIRVR